MNELVTPRTNAAEESLAERRGMRVLAIEALGPLTVLGGIVWAFAQPYRVTFFYPDGKGIWEWLVQPPLLVVLVGLLFSLVVAPGWSTTSSSASTEMLPRAEIAHWLFAAGFLFFALVLLAEAIVGPEVFPAAPMEGAPLAQPAALRRALALGDRDLLDVLDAPSPRARRVGAGRDGRGCGAARGRSRKTRLALLVARHRGRTRRLRRVVSAARAEPVALPALVVPAPLSRLDADHRRGVPARRGIPPRRPSSRTGSLYVVRRRGDLFADRDLAPVFGHLSPLAGGERVGETGSRRGAGPCSSPGGRPRMRRSGRDPDAESASTRLAAHRDLGPFDQGVTARPASIVVVSPDGRRVSGAEPVGGGGDRAPLRHCRGGVHRRWQMISADGHVV